MRPTYGADALYECSKSNRCFKNVAAKGPRGQGAKGTDRDPLLSISLAERASIRSTWERGRIERTRAWANGLLEALPFRQRHCAA
jgi:hypothetical protein